MKCPLCDSKMIQARWTDVPFYYGKGVDMKENVCEMTIIEAPDFKVYWECSECQKLHRDSVKFQEKTKCPSCGFEIVKWIGEDDYEEDEG